MLALVVFALAQAWMLLLSCWFSYERIAMSLDLVALVLAPSIAWFVWFFVLKMDD